MDRSKILSYVGAVGFLIVAGFQLASGDIPAATAMASMAFGLLGVKFGLEQHAEAVRAAAERPVQLLAPPAPGKYT